jgi:hypothetical protein
MNESQRDPQGDLQQYNDHTVVDVPTEDIEEQQYDEYGGHDVTTYLSWHAPGRPYKARSTEYYINSFLILMAVEIILFFFSQYLLMLVVFSLAFLAFALAVIPPHVFYYRISSEGLRLEDTFFIWDELYDFYFLKRHGQDVLFIRTKAYFPGELTITLGDITTQQIKNVLIPYLPFREYVKPTFMERAGEWLEKNFPLERSTTA